MQGKLVALDLDFVLFGAQSKVETWPEYKGLGKRKTVSRGLWTEEVEQPREFCIDHSWPLIVNIVFVCVCQ